MAYTPLQDGTQAFAIPASPVTINAVTYIAEDITINNPTKIVDIADSNGIPSGQAILQAKITGTMKLQLATSGTALPPKGTDFTLFGAHYFVTDVSEVFAQGAYTYVNCSFVMKIN